MSKLIILETIMAPKPNVRVCFWIDVPTGQEEFYAAIRNVNENGDTVSEFIHATAGELTAIENGDVVEIVESHEFEIGTSLNDMKAAIVARGAIVVAEVASEVTFQYYGVYYDTSWHNPT